MNELHWTLTGLSVAAVTPLTVAHVRLRHRLRVTERQVAGLEDRLADVDATTRHAVDTARAAEAYARRPADAPPGDPPRVILEPLTGRLVKAVALGAGARRAVTRLARGSRSARP